LVSVSRLNVNGGKAWEFRVHYVYDTFDRLVAREVTSVGQIQLTGRETHYIYSLGQPYADATASGTITARYLFGPGGEPLASLAGLAIPNFYLSDRQNSVLQIVNTSGSTLKRIEYSGLEVPDGKREGPASSDRFELGGQFHDGNTGLSMLNGRWLAPQLGRFLTEGGRGIGLNPYPVAENNHPNEIKPQPQPKPVSVRRKTGPLSGCELPAEVIQRHRSSRWRWRFELRV
jgi:hypothetical protein